MPRGRSGNARPEREGSRAGRGRALKAVFRLRPEEAIALLFLLPTTYLTVVANVYAHKVGDLGDRHPGGVARLAAALGVLAFLGLARRLWPRAAWVEGLREILPFLVCILIYTNLHDTIGFVNPRDVHHTLAALDEALFGVQPCVWAERFVTPARTEVMQLFYMSFLWIAPSTSVILLLRRRWREFRAVTMAVLVCFYLGYFLYVIFPAAPPRLVFVYDFTRSLEGYPRLFSNLSARAFTLLPVDSRAAFPSLHAAISLTVMVYAWRWIRPWFWALVPLSIGLWASTIYLRHHFAVDLIAGWMLSPVAIALAPRLDRWWTRHQLQFGVQPPKGAGE